MRFQKFVPRTAMGVNEYVYALSLRHHDTVRAGGRHRVSLWEIDATAARPALRVHTIKLHQYEAPAAVVATVQRLWRPDFDTMATPLSAVCANYATLEDDVLKPDTIPAGSVVYVNPAYAPAVKKNGAEGIDLHLSKLIEVDVHERGCTLIALLPALPHTDWFRRHVGACHEINFVSGKLVFRNPYRELKPDPKCYLWECRSYVLCVWRPGAAPAQPVLCWLTLDAPRADTIELRSCAVCGRVRVLPRWLESPDGPALRQGTFVCASSPDAKYNSCGTPEFVFRAKE